MRAASGRVVRPINSVWFAGRSSWRRRLRLARTIGDGGRLPGLLGGRIR